MLSKWNVQIVYCTICVCLAGTWLGCSGGGQQGAGAAPAGGYSGSPDAQIIAAVQVGDVATVKSLLATDPGLANAWEESTGKGVLHFAAEGTSTAIVSLLLEKGADPAVADNEGRLPVNCAREAHSSEAVTELLAEAYKKAAGIGQGGAPAQQ